MRVTSVRYEPLAKAYRLANQRILRTHRYGCLGPTDDVVVVDKNNAYVRCQNGHAQILPVYTATDSLMLGTKKIHLIIKEIETEEELAGYHQLEEYHYRGKALHGRRVPLIVRSKDPLLPSVLGYIEMCPSDQFMITRI